ncbi:uncharacterized protein LOC144446732 [Glandiceps talaboti]
MVDINIERWTLTTFYTLLVNPDNELRALESITRGWKINVNTYSECGTVCKILTMFITVKYGDGKSEIFNPNCLNIILLHNIRERCECAIEDLVELSDETGNVMNLLTNPTDYGKQYLTERAAFVLLKAERDGEAEDERYTYQPLLDGLDTNKEFLARLNPKPVLPKQSHESNRNKEIKAKNEELCETPSPNSKDLRRRGAQPNTPTGGASKSKPQQTNALKRGSSKVQLGRR